MSGGVRLTIGPESQRLVGRARELEQLDDSLSDAIAGRGSVVVVTGEPGIGKTALARAFVEHAAARGASSAWGSCWDGGGAPAYWPWVQIARALTRREDAATLRAGLGPGAPWIAGLLPELAGTLGPPAAASDLNADQARFRLFDALASLIATVAARRPLVIVLDDLHWADASSLLALEFVGRTLPDLPVVALAAYRHSEAHARKDLASALGGLARTARRLALEGLSREDVGRLATERAHGLEHGKGPAIAPALVAAVHDASAGNPFFVDELVQLLASQGRLHDEAKAGDPLPLPEGVRDTLARRLAPLGEPALRTLSAAAVIGSRFRIAALARVVGDEPGAVLEALDGASRAGLVRARGEGGRYEFVHALVRDTLLGTATASQRVRLHLRAAEALERLYADDLDAHLAEIAHHYLQGVSEGGAQQAVDYAARAARRATGQFAYEEAVRLLERAIEVAASLPADDLRAWELHHALGEALLRAGDLDGSLRVLRAAAAYARRLGAARHLALTALAGTLTNFTPGGVDAERVAVLEEALARLDEDDGGDDDLARRAAADALRCRVRVQLALALYWSPQHERRERLVGEALTLARGLYSGEAAQRLPAQRALAERALAFALAQGFLAVWGPDTVERGLPISVEVLELCERTNDAELAMQVRLWRISLLLELDDPLRADAEIEAYGATARRLRQPRTLVYEPLHRALRAHMQGDLAAAERFTAEAIERARGIDGSMAPLVADAQIFLQRRTRGRHHDLEPLLRRNADRLPFMRRWRCSLALVLAEMGRREEARKELEQLAAHDFADLPRDLTWFVTVALLAELCTLLDDRPRARLLYALLAPYEGRNVVSIGAAYIGPVARYLGLLAMTIGEDERALGHLETARSAAQRIGARPNAVLAALDAAEVLARRGAPGDAQRGATLVEGVGEEAARIGMDDATVRVAGLRVRLHEAASRDPAPPAPPSGAAVARLLREGAVWRLDHDGRSVRLQDAKGLRQLATLLANPGRAIAAAELAASGEAGGQGGLAEQRERARELQEELAEARSFNDPERVARARALLDALAGELARAAGATAPAERARVNVTRALRAALRRIAEHDPELGRLLQNTIRTGASCAYMPDPETQLRWEVRA